MKKYYTHSDGGCFLFGNKDFSFKLPNGFGDCRNTVLVFDSYEEYKAFCIKDYGEKRWTNAFEWKMPICGKINLYNYDCSDLSDKDIKARFEGCYDIYLRCAYYEYPILAIVKKDNNRWYERLNSAERK